MAKVLSGLTLTAPASPFAGENGDTFTFTVTPTFTGTAAVQGYDLKFLVNPAGAGFVTIAPTTGLSSSATNPIVNTTSSTALSITVACAQPGAFTIEAQGAPTSGGSFTVTSSTQSVSVIAPGAYTQDTTLVQRRAPMDHLDDPAFGQPPFASGIPMSWLQSDYGQNNSRRIAPRHLDNPIVPNRVPTLPPQQTLVQTNSDNLKLAGPRNNSDISNGPYPVTLPPVMVATQAGPSTVTITEQSVYYPTAFGIGPVVAPVAVRFVDGVRQYAKVARLNRLLADEVRPILVPTPVAATVTFAHQHSDLRPRAAGRAQWDGFAAPPAIAPGEFLVSYVSQWHHQWDTTPRAKPRPFDHSRSEMPLNFTSAVVSSFVSQWMPQHDLRRLAPPRALDRSFATMDGVPRGEFLISYVSQWGMPEAMRSTVRGLRLPPEAVSAITPQVAAVLAAIQTQDGYLLLAKRMRTPSVDASIPLAPVSRVVFVQADDQPFRRSPVRIVLWNGESVFLPAGAQPVLIDQWSIQSDILRLSSKMRLSDEEAMSLLGIIRGHVHHQPLRAAIPVREVGGGERIATVRGAGAKRSVDGDDRR